MSTELYFNVMTFLTPLLYNEEYILSHFVCKPSIFPTLYMLYVCMDNECDPNFRYVYHASESQNIYYFERFMNISLTFTLLTY